MPRTEKKTLKGFKLPPIKASTELVVADDDVKMPPLPLKSVLRRKASFPSSNPCLSIAYLTLSSSLLMNSQRQNLAIKTKKPPVTDLKGRDNAKDTDVFGDDGDVIDAEDPWAQFEVSEEELARLAKKREAVKVTVKKIPFYETAPFLLARKYYNIVSNFCVPKMTYLIGLCRRHAKLYPFKALKNEDGETIAEGTTYSPCLSVRVSPTVCLIIVGEVAKSGKKDEPKMTFNQALLGGHLLRDEYLALASWYGGMLLIMIYGLALSATVAPSYLGLLIWTSSWLFICTVIPIIKYFNTYTFDETMRTMIQLTLTFHFFFCLFYFLIGLNMDIGLVGTLWLLDYFLYYPLFVYILFEAYRWYDCGFLYEKMDVNGDGKISLGEFLTFIQSFPFVIFAVVVFNWQLYVWVNYLCGETVTLFLIVCGLGYLFVRDWAVNEFYLSPELTVVGGILINLTLFITFMAALFSSSIPLLSSSVFCFTLCFKIMIKNLSRRYLLDAENTVVFFSPYIFPVYSYNARLQDLVDESRVVKDLIAVLAIGIAWGSLLAVFYYPVNIGIAIACSFLLGAGAMLSMAVSYVPGKTLWI